MKRFMTLLAALLLCLTLTLPALAESKPLTMEGSFVRAFGYSVEEWMATEASRATFVTLAMLDVSFSGDEQAGDVAIEALQEGVVYVGSNADSVACYLFGKTTCLTLAYAPATGSTAALIPMGDMDAATMMAALQAEKQYTTCGEVSVETVLTMMQLVVDMLVQ